MNFCSKYGYNYGCQGSDDENIEDQDKVTIKIRKADTNIIAVNFDRLLEANELYYCDYKQCKKCDAILTAHSKKSIETNMYGKMIWTCEFCAEKNEVTSSEILPNDDDVTFMIQERDKNQFKSINVEKEGNYLTFCIDTSDSMNEYVKFEKNPNYDTKTTRLGVVKQACIKTTNALKENDPNKLVSLVTFSSNVKFFGDCSNVDAVIDTSSTKNNDKNICKSKEKLIQLAQNQDGNIMPISSSYKYLESKINSLSTNGLTALGPALVFSVVFSAKKAGSQVILCTDGCANIGIGNIESALLSEAEDFYDNIANYAKEHGVIINVISMKGNGCKLSLLGKLADKSNGTLKIVQPTDLDRELNSIVANTMVATNVKAKLIVNHKYLYIRDEKLTAAESKALYSKDMNVKEELNKIKKSFQEKYVGNAMNDTEITFEYGLRKLKKLSDEELNKIPFQLQVSYTTLDGSKAIRVYTQIQEFTKERRKAESNITNKNILFNNASQKIGCFTIDNSVRVAQNYCKGVERLIKNNDWQAPLYFECKAKAVGDFDKDMRYDMMDDKDVVNMYCCERRQME